MSDITEEVVGSLGITPEGTHDVTERTITELGYSTVPVLMAMYVTGNLSSQAAVGTARTVARIDVTAVSGSAAVGSPTIGLGPIAVGIPSGVTFGQAKTVATASASGFASAGSMGTPRGVEVMSPQGFAESSQVGTPATSVTLVVVPGAIDPSDGFGDPVATKYGWIFRPPVNTYKWRLFKEYEGISLLKENGVWSEVAHPDLPRTKDAEMYLAGGRDHVVGDALKAELEGLGYTVTQEPVTTEEYL